MHPGDDPSPSQTPLPSALYHLEKFEGNGLIPFDKFIRDFELVYDVKALDDSRRRILLDNHLRGAAREFALQASQIKLGYNEVKENLEQRFSRRAPKREARKKFFSCRQRPGEKVKEYANRVRSLASEAESDGLRIDITEVADIFLTGLCPNLWQRAHQLQNESWEVIVSSLHQIEERDDEYSRCQMEDEEGSARKLRELTSQMARLESKLKNLETEKPRPEEDPQGATQDEYGKQVGQQPGQRFPAERRFRSEQPAHYTRDQAGETQQNPNGRAPQEQRKEGPPATTKGGTPKGYEGPEATRTPIRCFRCGETGHMARICTAMTKKIGPACLKAGNGGTLAGLPVITCTFVDKGWSLSNRTIRLIIDTGSEANIVNIDSLDISAEGLGKPTFLKGISGSELRSLGSELIEVRAYIRGKPIREVKTTFEYCHLGGLGFDGILGMPGFKALRLTLNHDGSVRSDFEQDEEPTKSAFLSSLQASEVPVRPPSIPLHKIRTGEDVLRAYSHCFCDDISDMGDGSTIIAPKLKILTGKPVYRRQYPIPNKLVSKVKALVDELEEAGIIEGSTSLWNSPLFPVAKTDGSVRITMDLRLINEVTEFFPFPIPRVEDNLRAFAGAKVFSTLDLTSGFFQIHIPEGDRDYFTFSLPWGRYRFTRLPQGAKNSAQIFQWAMNLVLGDLLYKCVRLYIDDVIVYSDSHEQHVADLAAVLERLSRFNLKARRGKSYFFKGSVDYLGHCCLCSTLKHLLAGSKVEVHTDHKPITYNKGSDYKNARLSRWAEIIQDFNVTFVYVPGKENTVADFLSRFPCEDDPEPSRDKRVVAAVIKNRGPPLIDSDRTWEVRNFHPGSAREFAAFAKGYGFHHVTSSPKFLQSNGMAEAGVKIVKKNQDPSLGLLEYRATPLENGYSPAELLMGRQLRTKIPATSEVLLPKLVYSEKIQRKEKKSEKKKYYDKFHGAKDLDELEIGDLVWIVDLRTWGNIMKKAPTPRFYFIETPRGVVRRNRFHLRKGYQRMYPLTAEEIPDKEPVPEVQPVPEEQPLPMEEPVPEELHVEEPQLNAPANDGQYCTRSGRVRMPGHRKRRQFKQTDAFTRGMVIGLKRAGWSIRQIAADTHLGASTVHRLWRRWLEQGNVAIYRNAGATRVTSARVDRRILRQAVAAPQATCTAILQHVQDTLDHSISTRTISRRLVANGLHSCRPLRRLPLTPPNRRQRLEWCRARSTWMTEWHRVVFSDESRFCLSSDSRRVRVWRRRGERSNPAAIVERPTGGQRGIMVWGAIAYDSRSPLLRIQGTMTAQRYIDDVLRPVTLPYLQGVPNALYQQDNARPHTARISQQALQNVQMLPWPPYSPDLSPIEHVWDIIGRRLHSLPQPRSEDELWQMVEREWRAIPQDAIRTLIDSLPRRVAACIAIR
ncbi:hypothetical protein LAZ67_9003122, partial [Cordylochernes scorpioides]